MWSWLFHCSAYVMRHWFLNCCGPSLFPAHHHDIRCLQRVLVPFPGCWRFLSPLLTACQAGYWFLSGWRQQLPSWNFKDCVTPRKIMTWTKETVRWDVWSTAVSKNHNTFCTPANGSDKKPWQLTLHSLNLWTWTEIISEKRRRQKKRINYPPLLIFVCG